jgi:hypothetical protein
MSTQEWREGDFITYEPSTSHSSKFQKSRGIVWFLEMIVFSWFDIGVDFKDLESVMFKSYERNWLQTYKGQVVMLDGREGSTFIVCDNPLSLSWKLQRGVELGELSNQSSAMGMLLSHLDSNFFIIFK